MVDKVKRQWSTVCYTFRIISGINKKLFVGVVSFSALGALFPLMSLLATQRILNALQLLEGPLTYLVKLIVMYIAISFFGSALQTVSSYYGTKLSTILSYDISYMLMKKCGELSLGQLEETNTYDMISRLEGEVSIKPFMALQNILNIVYALITYVFSMIVLYKWKPLLFVLFLVVSIFFFIYYLRIGHQEFQMRFQRSEKEREAWYYTHLLTHDTAFKEIKVLSLNNYFLKKYKILIRKFVDQEMKINRKKISLSTFMIFLENVLSFLVMYLAITEAYTGLILIGTAMVYINIVGYIESNTSSLANSSYNIYICNMYMDLLKEFLEMDTAEQEKSSLVNEIENITVKSLSFDYPGKENILSDISFQIHKGECVAVVGKNGSGKSTLLKLLCGLYDYRNGQILINGMPLSDIDQNLYRKQISVLFQDYLRLEGTLEENIRIGDINRNNANMEDISKALENADVDFLIKGTTYDFNSTIGNWFAEGSQVSGGQWQKIALARAYYKEASVYLLDEPSAALDVNAEMKVFNSFFQYCEKKIGIYITHRLKIAQRADKVVMIDNGKIIGIGTHEELYNNCELYKELYIKEQKI